ncbi:MAG: PQQ-dependent sugar dehydrogenase [Nitriliruptorales bacterium]
MAALTVTVNLVGLTLAPGSSAAAATSLPAGFVLLSSSSGQGQYNLTDFSYLPDGSILTSGKDGTVNWVPAGGTPRRIARLPVLTDGDLGLVGLAVAPDYSTTRRVYTTRALSAPDGRRVLRLSGWTVTGDEDGEPAALAEEAMIVETSADSNVHAMTGVVASEDGTLWVSIGDSGSHTAVNPQTLRTLHVNDAHGKLLHILPDGRGVPSNPSYDPAAPTAWRSRVYASGFRSPFRLSLDPASGAPILGDVGWNTYEEVNVVRPGASYGWPCWEGPEPTPGYRDLPECSGVGHTPPLWSYDRQVGGSITGGLVYTGESYPAAYQGAYFFGDYVSKRLWTLTFDAGGRITRAPETAGFASEIGGPVKLAAGPGGDIVFADLYDGTMHRLTYTPGNRAPTAEAKTATDPDTRTVAFDASRSSDLDGDAISYAWDFGDGTTGTGMKTSHTYVPGDSRLTARLTVTDSVGNQDSIGITVAPFNHAPTLALQGPATDRTYAVGDTVEATATTSDDEDGALPVRWRTDLVHCRGAVCHSHPGSSQDGDTYAVVFDDHGDDTRMEVRASASDGYGVVTEQTFIAHPALRRLTLASSTPATMEHNGRDSNAALVAVGSTNSVAAAATATDGVATFDRWDDASGRQRTLVMPDGDVTLTARYATPIDRRYASDPAFRSVLGAATDTEQGGADLRWRDFQAGRAYWSPSTDVREVHGAIAGTYQRLGAHVAYGVPATDETPTPDGAGRFNHFTGGRSIYWTSTTGAHAIWGAIRDRWKATGWETGPLGYPTTDESPTPDGVGRFNHFSKAGSIYWTPGAGAHAIWGAIRDRWKATGWETGPLGYPTTDESPTPDGVGRFNHFSKAGSIYWTPGTGAREVYGAIRARWAQLGWERSYLGYPTSGEFSVPGGRRSNFQQGYIVWDARTGAVTDRRY